MNLQCYSLYQALKAILDRGHKLPSPDGILVNGRGPNQTYFTFQPGNFLSHGYSLWHVSDLETWKDQNVMNHGHCISYRRKNLQAQNIKCWAPAFSQFSHSRPQDEASWSGGHSHSSDYVFVTGCPCRTILFGAGHRWSDSSGLLHCCLYSFHHQDPYHHCHTSLQQLRQTSVRSNPWWTNHRNRLVS